MNSQCIRIRALRVLAAGVFATFALSTFAQPVPPASDGRAGDPAVGEALRTLIARARDRVFPALVNIHVVTVDYWDGKETKHQATGSGTIIAPDGYVLTNQHVVDDGKVFRVTLADKREFPAVLVGEDPMTDLAVLRITRGGDDAPFPAAGLGDSSTLQVGDTVMAMGSPFSLSRSVTLGIVSNTERVFTAGPGDQEIEELLLDNDQTTGQFTRWIQHDAAINPGNSGGPLVNLRGEVIGVNTRGGSNMGFASPANLAADITAKLIKHGEVPRSWLGLDFRHIERTGLKAGVLVASVAQDGPGARAGLKAGDVVLAIDGTPLTVRFAEEIPPLQRRLADTPIGGTVTLEYQRDGARATANVVTEKLLKQRGDEAALRAWGVSVAQITPRMARDRRLDSTKGVLITSVRDGSPAALAEPDLAPGDIIHGVGGQAVESHAAIVKRYQEIMGADPIPEFLLVEYDRRGKSQVTLIKPRPQPPVDPTRELPKAWLGVAIQPVAREMAAQLGHAGTTGFRVTRVYPGTLAASTELRVGDLITAINGDALAPRGAQDAGLLNRRIRALNPGDEIAISVLRAGATLEVRAKLERTRFGADEAKRDTNRDFELGVREITFFDRDDRRLGDDVEGVLVEHAENAGWAGLAGMRPGDVLMRVASRPVPGVIEFRQVMAELAKSQPERVEFVVLRNNRTFYRFAEPDWKPLSKPATAPGDAPGAAPARTPPPAAPGSP